MILTAAVPCLLQRQKPPRRNRNFPEGDANKGALKKQIRRHLNAAMKLGTLDELEEALRMCERYDVQPDGEYFKAIRKVEYLRIKEGLRNAVRRRHIGTLEKAIQTARASPFARQLASAISAADKLRTQLVQYKVHRHAPPDLEQSTVSEIRSFKAPPRSVVTVMTAVHRLLGYKYREVLTWQRIQTLMGQSRDDGLISRVKRFDPSVPGLRAAEHVDQLLKSTSYDEVLMASNGTARFYVWASNALDKVYGELGKGKRKKKKKK
ncbi:hypothetical protein BaRGS_00016972 [Batillaria attramentaria]|uniref:Uncharacterized protein n=1 Tax=Batillaria attramentaria TaxID=370345 RepID=A0ABD0KXB8_9CAEN